MDVGVPGRAVHEKHENIFWFLPHADESMAIEALLRLRRLYTALASVVFPALSIPTMETILSPVLPHLLHWLHGGRTSGEAR
jgi:hypothetical protein